MTDKVQIVYDERGNVVIHIDYVGKGWYAAAHGNEHSSKVLRRAKSIVKLVKWVSGHFEGDPQVSMSDVCWAIWSLENSDGQEWWNEILDEEIGI